MLIDTESEPGSWEHEMQRMPWWVKAHVIPDCPCDDRTECGCHVKVGSVEIENIELSTDEPS